MPDGGCKAVLSILVGSVAGTESCVSELSSRVTFSGQT